MEKKRIIGTEIVKAILIAGFLILSVGVFAKSHGKLTKYHQVTDKEVLMVTGKGVKVLFSAYDASHWSNRFCSRPRGKTDFTIKLKASRPTYRIDVR